MSESTVSIQSPVSIRGEAVVVKPPAGAPVTLPHLWLRDNCDCDQCRVAQTGEKKFMLSDVPADISPRRAELIDDVLALEWPDGHETRYALDAIRALARPRHEPTAQWPPGFKPRRTDWDAFLQDDATAAEALTHFLRDGVMLLNGAPQAPAKLEDLASRLGPIREVLFDRIHDVRADPSGYNVAHTPFALPPHNDFASYTWPPSVQALHMIVNDAAGGESIVVDGFALVNAFRESHPVFFEALVSTAVPFREFDAETETFAVEPIIRLNAASEVTGLRFSNQLMQMMHPETPGIETFYPAYRELCRWVDAPDFRASFRLEGGDVLIVAAHRVLHARRAFESTGERHLQDAYFELDNVANQLIVLNRQQRSLNR